MGMYAGFFYLGTTYNILLYRVFLGSRYFQGVLCLPSLMKVFSELTWIRSLYSAFCALYVIEPQVNPAIDALAPELHPVGPQ